MDKKLIISGCMECYHFDFTYYDWKEECCILKRKIESNGAFYPIPDDCPLEDSDE